MTELAANSIVSTTVEDALLEILRMIADLQATTATNPQNRTVITQFTQNELTGLFTVSLSIPSSLSYGDSGVVANASEVFL
ncbi:hypothetical protein [Tychonema sp. LEGE 06208]|uniref:hypothetical protein n=1 Tax=Tychonema sp. LEGE 06208 TaxID=1828663 RepID=UPI001880A674|nr:hypothetical protein [Tychonema sp. LEGE 06208]MBE9164187.1 hypothetical protein [Tychonema sp. LEGE 06208]